MSQICPPVDDDGSNAVFPFFGQFWSGDVCVVIKCSGGGKGPMCSNRRGSTRRLGFERPDTSTFEPPRPEPNLTNGPPRHRRRRRGIRRDPPRCRLHRHLRREHLPRRIRTTGRLTGRRRRRRARPEKRPTPRKVQPTCAERGRGAAQQDRRAAGRTGALPPPFPSPVFMLAAADRSSGSTTPTPRTARSRPRTPSRASSSSTPSSRPTRNSRRSRAASSARSPPTHRS